MDESAIRRRVEEARAGDADAFGALFEAFRPDVLRLCQRMLGHADAEDAVHEAFLRARAGLPGFEMGRPFRPWLLAIASRHAIDRLRRRDTERRIFAAEEAPIESLPGPDPSPLQGELSGSLRRQVLAAVDALPDRYRAPIVLRYFTELSYDEIAEMLDVSKNQVATLLFRGRRHLREALDDVEETA